MRSKSWALVDVAAVAHAQIAMRVATAEFTARAPSAANETNNYRCNCGRFKMRMQPRHDSSRGDMDDTTGDAESYDDMNTECEDGHRSQRPASFTSLTSVVGLDGDTHASFDAYISSMRPKNSHVIADE